MLLSSFLILSPPHLLFSGEAKLLSIRIVSSFRDGSKIRFVFYKIDLEGSLVLGKPEAFFFFFKFNTDLAFALLGDRRLCFMKTILRNTYSHQGRVLEPQE